MPPATRSFVQRALDRFSYPQTADKYADLLRTAAPAKRIPARVITVSQESPTCHSLVLRPRRWNGHTAGQFVTVTINVDGVWQHRCYTISSSSHDRKTITITVQAQASGGVSRHLHSLQPGAALFVSEPLGEFVPADTAHSPLLFITGGSGITPVMSMLRSGVLDDGRAVCHVHYAPDHERTIFRDELAALAAANPNYQLATQHTQDGSSYYSRDALTAICPDWQQRPTWLCGPEGLMKNVQADFATANISAQLTTEAFAAPTTPHAPGESGHIQFVKSGQSADTACPTLLETAEAAGLKPQYGCRLGICHSCDCHLQSGTVRNIRTGALIHTSKDRGPVYIQPCITAAVGDIEIDL